MTMRMAVRSGAVGLVVALLLGACSQEQQAESAGSSDATAAAEADANAAAAAEAAAAPAGGNRLRAASRLAYEHDVRIRIDADAMPARLAAVRKACDDARFGDCVVLALSEAGGEQAGARLQLRAVPKAIEPLVALAGEGGTVGSRETRAEDLAVAVQDNAMLQDRLRREHARLLEFQSRPDLKIADMLTLSQRLAETESQLEGATQVAAQFQRRIDTQLLSLGFETGGAERGRGDIGAAWRDAGSLLASSVAGLLRATAVLLPFALLALLAWAVVRFLRRRRAAPPRGPSA